MSYFERTPAKHADDDLPWIGAMEITSFNGYAANDNGAGEVKGRQRSGILQRAKAAGWALPMAAFASGLTAALLVTGLGEFLGVGG